MRAVFQKDRFSEGMKIEIKEVWFEGKLCHCFEGFEHVLFPSYRFDKFFQFMSSKGWEFIKIESTSHSESKAL